MTSQQFLLCDNSTATNFKSWASAISNFIRSCGWTNSSDTGQLNGAGAGNWAGVSTVPGAGLFYYEMFQPGDGLQNFYLKLEYGNSTSLTNSPTLRITLSTLTNGAGTCTGFVTAATQITNGITAPSNNVTYECNLSGDSGRLSMLLWRNAPNLAPQIFAIQRSLNASGSPTSTYVTQWTDGNCGQVSNSFATGMQQSLHFFYGPSPLFGNGAQMGNGMGWPSITVGNASGPSSLNFAQSIPAWFLQPCVGVFDYPCTVVGVASGGDLTEGVPFTITNQYGQTKTYIPTRAGVLYRASSGIQSNTTFFNFVTVLVEYD